MLVFVDESEWPRPSTPEGYTVWAAIAIQSERNKAFSRDIFELERKFWDVKEPYEYELKGRELLSRKGLTSPKKVEFVEELLSLCRQHDLKAFAVGFREDPARVTLFPVASKEFRMYPILLERIEQMMVETYPGDMAHIVIDSRGTGMDKKRALEFGNFLYGHVIGQKLQRIVSLPFLVESSLASGIQIADLFAYALSQQNLGGRREPELRKICDQIRGLEWRSSLMDVEYPMHGFRFLDIR